MTSSSTRHSNYCSGKWKGFIPVKRPFCGRWFDDATVLRQMIEDNLAPRPAEASMAADRP